MLNECLRCQGRRGSAQSRQPRPRSGDGSRGGGGSRPAMPFGPGSRRTEPAGHVCSRPHPSPHSPPQPQDRFGNHPPFAPATGLRPDCPSSSTSPPLLLLLRSLSFQPSSSVGAHFHYLLNCFFILFSLLVLALLVLQAHLVSSSNVVHLHCRPSSQRHRTPISLPHFLHRHPAH